MAEPKPIPVDGHLWRRVPEMHWIDDGAGGLRPSSAAFEDDPEGSPMSTILAEESTLTRAFEPVRALPKPFALARFPVRAATDKDLKVERDPTSEEPAHVLVLGNKTKGVRNALVRASVWAWPPPGRPYP
jgi:hypothetical protein